VQFVDNSSNVTAESRKKTYSLKIRYSRTDCFHFPLPTVNKLGKITEDYGKARPVNQLFNAVNDRFLLTFLTDSINQL